MEIEEKAVTREVTDCPICLRSLDLNETNENGNSRYLFSIFKYSLIKLFKLASFL